MSRPLTGRPAAIRASIESFLSERLDTKLKGLPDDDPKRATLAAQFVFSTWIADAARRAGQIQLVTHALKGGHPDARGTSLYAPPAGLPQHPEIGSQSLGDDFTNDVVGNAAALDVNGLLRIDLDDGSRVLDLVLQADPDLLAALSGDDDEARAWLSCFATVSQARGPTASHTQAKQLYWLTGEDASDDGAYHLLAPVYASSLAHKVYLTINADRFDDTAKAARQARYKGEYSDQPAREYPHLAVQKLGGTKPQNISQLNSERRGTNYLLASLPPLWNVTDARPPYRIGSVLARFFQRPPVKALTRQLRLFLESSPPQNKPTRDHRDVLVAALADELFQMEQELRLLAPGWSAHADCRLVDAERYWLDPWRSETDSAFATERQNIEWPQALCKRFANWLNDELNGQLLMDDPAYRHWYGLLRDEFEARRREGLLDD